MTDKGSYKTIAFCVDPGWVEVENIFDQVKKECGMSRSTCIRTIVHTYLGTQTDEPLLHTYNLDKLNRALATLGRK